MRLSPLLVILACACATASSSSTPAAAGTAAADAGTSAAAGAADAGAQAAGAADAGAAAMGDAGSAPTPAVATATLEPRSGSSVTGNARVTPTASGVVVLVQVQHAAPGEHGVHVHEKGDCSDPAATSAGPHFNPKAAAHHGGVSTPVRHGGDLGNMQVDASGNGLLVVAVSDLNMDNVVGRAVVVHEKKDDLQSDPAGNSGARVACGTLQAASN